MSASTVYQRVNTAWMERRLENVLQRQKELANLHTNVKKQSTELVKAIGQDLHTTPAAAAEELRLVLDVIKALYGDLDFPGALCTERSIKAGHSISSNLFALGPTLIVPATHCPFSSTMIPLAAAVAAGSAVVVLLEPSTTSTNNLLQKLILESFDHEAVGVVLNCQPEPLKDLISRHFGVAVLQSSDDKEELKKALLEVNPSIRIHEPATGLPAIFVDRTTKDLENVAAHLHAMVLQSSRSDTSKMPRMCFVDEFLTEELGSLLEKATYTADLQKNTGVGSSGLKEMLKSIKATFPASYEQRAKKSNSPVIQISNTDSSITAETVGKATKAISAAGKVLLLIPIRSLDHGIDMFNKVNGTRSAQAIYVFADGKSAFYIGSFTNAQQVFVNDIPLRASVEVNPSTSGQSYELPYRPEDFSNNKPIIQTALSKPCNAATDRISLSSHNLNLGKIKQPKGGRMSFFEQGLILGVAILLTATSTALYLSRKGLHYSQRR
ncbi:hypothetical protein LTR84_009579 [Exophiala bonariae]|uniref:Aldehyde dehydrogenase domain-containing protein n=1 Tax=Exophiala bonariae TaxID=1690606 RepID=A0AAV9NN06_9EURO|nr:hypothetical protein LTR84_009579 [Exophiala bonariae]